MNYDTIFHKFSAWKGFVRMSALASDYTGNTVLIYDTYGNHLASTTVKEHDRDAKQIRINSIPDGLSVNDECKLFILSSPAPCEFSGKVKKIGGNPFIGMFQGQEKENRGATRYPVTTPALITVQYINGKPYPLQTPLTVTLKNISTSGVRFTAPYYSLDVNDEFEMHLIINNARKKITAKVVNNLDGSKETTDYGCIFLTVE